MDWTIQLLIAAVCLAIILFLPKSWRWSERRRRTKAGQAKKTQPTGLTPGFGRRGVVVHDPVDDVHREIDLAYSRGGRAALTEFQRHFRGVYAIDSFVQNGGFDAYLAHAYDPAERDDAISGLEAMGRSDAAKIVEDAIAAEGRVGSTTGSDQAATRSHLEMMAAFDRRWDALGIDARLMLSRFVARRRE